MFSKKFLKVWDGLETYTAGLLTTTALALSFYQVVMRYVFNDSPEGAEEGIVYLIIWAVFIISSRLVRDDEHIGADFLVGKLPANTRRWVALVTTILALCFCVVVVYYGAQIVHAAVSMNERSTTRLRFPMWIAYLSVPVGTTLIGASCFYRLHLLLCRFSPELFQERASDDGLAGDVKGGGKP